MPRTAVTVLLLLAALLCACSSASAPLAPTIEPAAGGASAPAGSAPAGSAAGSSAPAVDAGGAVTITFGAQEYERQIYQPLIDTFNQENPDLRVQFVSLDEIFNPGSGQAQNFDPNSMMRRIVSAADTAVNWSISPEAVRNSYVRDLKPLIDADPSFDLGDYWAGALSSGQLEGGTYMLPRTMRIRLLNYNKDLFTARGVAEPKVDWSWQDMLAIAEQVAKKNGDTVETYGYLDWSPESTVLFNELAIKGINIWSMSSDQVKLDQPEFAQALDRTKTLVDSGAIFYQNRDPSAAISGDQFQPLISEQKAAIWPLELMSMGPQQPALPFEVGLLPYPELPVPSWNGGTDGYLMSSGTQHENEAWRWLSYLSRQEIKQPYAGPDALSMVPARKSVTDASGYWGKLDAEVGAALKASLERPQAPPPSSTNDGRFYEPLNKAIQAVLSGKQDSPQALQEAQQSFEQLLAQASPSAAAASADTSPVVVATPVSDVAPAGAKAITFGSFGIDPSVARRLAREFNQGDSGVWVEVKEIQGGPAPMTLTDIASQVDCFNWWGAPESKEMTATLDLKPLIDADAAFPIDDYPQALLAPYTRGEALHGLPQAVNFRMLMYNPTAFENAGLEPPAIGWTIDDFVNAAQQLTTGQGDTKQFGYVSLGGQTSDLVFFIQQAGASIITGSGDTAQPNFVDAKVVQAIRTYLDLLKNASPHEKITGYGRSNTGDDSYNLVSQGRAGMWFDYGYGFGFGGPDQQAKPAVAPLPLGGHSLAPEDVNVRGLHISAQTPNADACWTWLKHLSEQAGTFDGGFPARRSLVENETFAAQLPAGAADVYRAYTEVLDRAPQTAEAPKPYYMAKIDYFWLFRAIDRAMQGEDLERELGDAQAVTEQYTACVGGGGKEYECAKQVDPDYAGWQTAPEATP